MFKYKAKNKLYIIFITIFVFYINNYAAIVSDNDGSAFITKSEFDSLKNSFQSKVDSYNTSIDNKIDGAIASYLSGLQIDSRIDETLDKKYIFPLRYDTTEAWNNPDSSWFNLMMPQIYKEDIEFTNYLGLQNDAAAKGWYVNRSTSDNGVIKLATISNVQDGYKWEIMQSQHSTLQYDGKVGTYASVEKTGNTRTINIGGVNNDYNIYKCMNIGTGKQLIAYLGDFSESIVDTSQGNLYERSSWNPYTYWFMISCNGNIRNQTVSADGNIWTRNHLVSKQAGYRGNVAVSYQLGETYSLAGIKNKYTSLNAPFSHTRILIKDTTVVASEANDYQNNNTQYIFGRGSVMPANLKGNWNLIPKIYNNTSKVQFTVAIGTEAQIDKQFGWTWNTQPRTYACLIRTFPTFMPIMIANDNTEYDSKDTDSFSKLPSTLVTYEDSKGNMHYYDEGMFLGYYEKKGDVKFTVNFQKDSGTGSKVKLHVSKKPFSYDFDNSDLLEYTMNDTTGSEQELNYGISYVITVPTVDAGESLYIEWVPVTSGDLAALTSFDDYHMITES